MAMPFYAACLTENGEDNWDDILDQFTSAHKLLWDEQLGLYANDCSRKMEWADPVTGTAGRCGSVPRAGSSWHWRTPTRSATAPPVPGSCALC